MSKIKIFDIFGIVLFILFFFVYYECVVKSKNKEKNIIWIFWQFDGTLENLKNVKTEFLISIYWQLGNLTLLLYMYYQYVVKNENINKNCIISIFWQIDTWHCLFWQINVVFI